ncbi:putative RdRp-complex [Linepithema humile rhabdo-like virus 1]|uniref:RNA-directed RNA polymerase L n=1 Tax=Linepithema humile rhabdo-like virus 1 TaxID=2259786 RepID=A0AAD0LC50_9MONO|nr:putative RdRp-complex [Linepithema humile rhabdo-like virus 1]AXA52562.1 putative RdRp-complex [Linepithema humile rhabdo-like virus 1]
MNYPDSHLQSAIRIDERKYTFRVSIDKCPVYLKPYKITSPISPDQVNIRSENLYGIILRGVYDDTGTILKWVSRYLPSAFEVSTYVVRTTLQSLVPQLDLPNVQVDNYISRLISLCTIWEDIRYRMQFMLNHPCSWVPSKHPIGKIQKYHLSGKFMLAEVDNNWYCFGYDQVMMISDTIWARCNVLMYNHLLPTTSTSKIPPIFIEKCYSMIDNNFLHYGNNIYDGIKNWESIILGSLVEDYDPYDGGKEFLSYILKDMKDQGFLFMEELYNYIKSLKLLPDQYSELHGLYRHWGHPTVDERGACIKTKAISQVRPVPKLSTILESMGCLKRQYIVSFLQKHGRWPSIRNCDDIQNKLLRRMIKTHARHLNLYQKSITLYDWASIDFNSEMEFDYHLDYTELLDDKAISPYRSEFRSLFNPTILGYKPQKPKKSRRLLRAILEIESLDIQEIIMKIRRREIPPEWFIVILHSKERELKLKPRLFAMMILEMRMYFVVTEKNIALNIFPYFPQQTMTLSESDLSKRIYKFTEQMKPESYIPFYVMIDFKSWNIHWSEMSTFDCFKFIDDLLGVPGLYTFTHEFFYKCMVVLSSSLFPPDSVLGDLCKHGDPQECDTLWYNHYGGWEGLRQKGWTVATIALLLLVEHKTGIQSQIVGQADNQICKILIPRLNNGLSNTEYIKNNLSNIKEKIGLFTSTLDQVVSDIGLVLKKEESLVSSVLTIYGKEMTLYGAQLSQASKKISRALSEVNITVPSLYSKTLTLHSAGLGTSQKTHSPVIPCILSNVLSLTSFINGARYSLLTQKKNPPELWDWIEGENALMFILLGSGDTGGIPVQNIINYLYRGHPDSLTAYTTYLYILAAKNKVARRMYLYLQNNLYNIGDADPELLISNPCSTNISSFPLVSSRFRRKLEVLVQQKTRNKDLRDLFPSTSQQDDKKTFEFLLKFRPIQPRLLHEIFRLTPTCSRLTFLAKFSSTRTVYSMLREKQITQEIDGDWDAIDYITGPPSSIVLDDIDSGLLSHLKETYNKVREIIDIDSTLICPTALAKQIRQYSWKDLIGDHYLEGVTIPHPAHQFVLSIPKPGTHSTCNANPEHCIFSPISYNPQTVLSKRGMLPPYIGSRTREKVTGKIYTIPTTARPFKAAERAIILSDWCVSPNSSLSLYLSNIIKSRTDIKESDLRRIAGRISGGTSIHRLDSHMGHTSTLNNSLANVTTHILFTTDTMGRFSKGRENYVIHFQGIIHTGISLINIYITHQNNVPLTFHLHYDGHCCEEKIDDILVGGHFDVPHIPTYPNNPLLYTRTGNLEETRFESLKGITIQDHSDSSWALGFILLSRIRTRILSSQWGVTETSAPTVSSLGIQEVLRIGISRIIKSLAIILYLHVDYNDEGLDILLQSLSTDIWGDVSSIVLIPEVMIPTIKYLNLDGIADAHTNPKNISRCLNRALIKEVKYIQNHPSKLYNLKPYHIYSNVKISHILRMWGKVIFIKTDKRIDLRDIITKSLIRPREEQHDSSAVDQSITTKIINLVIKEYGVNGFIQVWKENPLKICYKPPETLLRIDPFPSPQMPLQITPTLELSIGKEPYPFMLSFPPPSDNLDNVKIEYSPGACVYKQKLRMDHYYRTVGQVSTAYLKYMEIILKDEIPLDGSAICTADGESSLGFMLYKLTGNPIIYNSLVDKTRLQPQRGYNYIPGSFLRYPEGVLNTESNTLLGGDITNKDVQDSIITYSLDHKLNICIITCDAESSIDFSLNTTLEIILSVCRIAYNVEAKTAIIKIFLIDSQVTSIIGGHLQMIWEDVKLVTPCFSSYESTECFWVCKNYKPRLKSYTSLNSWGNTNTLIIPQSSMYILPHLISFKEERSNLIKPIQQGRESTVKRLIKSALLLGYKSNLGQAFYIACNNLLFYDTEIQLRDNITNGIESLIKMTYDYLSGIQYVYEGKSLDLEVGSLITRGRTIHSTIESFIIAYRNFVLILNLFELRFNPSQADDFIHKSSVTDTIFQDLNNKEIYRYHDYDEHDWRQRYLKSIWKILGNLETLD